MLANPETSFQKKSGKTSVQDTIKYIMMTCELFGVRTCSLYILKGHILKFSHVINSHLWDSPTYTQDGRDITETEFEDLTSSRLKQLTAEVCFSGWVLDYFTWWYKWVAHLCQRYHYKLWSHCKRAGHSHWPTQLSICWWGSEKLAICN